MTRVEIETIPVLSDNYMYLLHEPQQGVTAVIDPPVAAPVLERLERSGRSLDWILATHHHADHTAGILELKQATGARVAGPHAEHDQIPGIDQDLREGYDFAIGAAPVTILATPGHTRGHISLWLPESKALFCADTLFSLGCGRLFEGTAEQMWSSLQKLAALPDDALVHCGHEYTSSNARFALTIDPENPALVRRAEEVERLRAEGKPTIPSSLGEEKAANPFLRAADPVIRRRLAMPDAADSAVFGEIRRRKDNA